MMPVSAVFCHRLKVLMWTDERIATATAREMSWYAVVCAGLVLR